MVICFKCDSETKALLDRLRLGGAYPDYSDIIVAAVANYALLNDELQSSGTVVIGEDAGEATPARPRKARSGQVAATIAPVRPHLVPNVPPLFLREPLVTARRENAFAQLPDDVFLPGQEVPLDRWPFGQFSKVLPAKAS